MLVAEINDLRDRIANLEKSKLPSLRPFLSDDSDHAKTCLCDVDYVGMHKWDCKFGRSR